MHPLFKWPAFLRKSDLSLKRHWTKNWRSLCAGEEKDQVLDLALAMCDVKSYELRCAGNAAMSYQVRIAQPRVEHGQNQVAIFHVQKTTKLGLHATFMSALPYFKVRRLRHTRQI